MVKKEIQKARQKIQFKQTTPILCDPNLKSYLETLHKRLVIVIIEKAANNFAFVCNKYYISKVLAEIDLSYSKSKAYSKVTHSIEETIQANINHCKNFDLNIIELDKSLPILY